MFPQPLQFQEETSQKRKFRGNFPISVCKEIGICNCGSRSLLFVSSENYAPQAWILQFRLCEDYLFLPAFLLCWRKNNVVAQSLLKRKIVIVMLPFVLVCCLLTPEAVFSCRYHGWGDPTSSVRKRARLFLHFTPWSLYSETLQQGGHLQRFGLVPGSQNILLHR